MYTTKMQDIYFQALKQLRKKYLKQLLEEENSNFTYNHIEKIIDKKIADENKFWEYIYEIEHDC
jgi:hypothetical protein